MPIKISSIQANSLYRVNNGDEKAFLDLGEAVINDSIFSNYMRKHGVTVDKKGYSKDFITLKFDYGVKDGLSAKALREHFYKNGAEVTWKKYGKEHNLIEEETIRYKMLMRNPGKAKEGECIFIRENLHEIALKYITMDLYDKLPTENAQIVELSAYSTLATATALEYLKVPLEHILIIQDEEVSTMARGVVVKTHEVPYEKEVIDWGEVEEIINSKGFTFKKKKAKEGGLTYIKQSQKALKENGVSIDTFPIKKVEVYKRECFVDRSQEKIAVKNVLWDGMGICDETIFPENQGMDGFIYCRSHFFKACLFRGNIQEYFKDYYGSQYECATVTDMFGNTIMVKDIKVIVTDKAIKWLKFAKLMGEDNKAAYRYYRKFMKKHNDTFEIIKTGHKSKWGDLQRSSYQMNNSLPCTDKEILTEIAQESIQYCNNMKINHEAFRKYLEITKSSYNINGVLLALDEWNGKAKQTAYFKEKRNDIIYRFKNERLKQGKLLQEGDNLTICGNPIALLKKATGQKDYLEEGCFNTIDDGIQCYTTRFIEGEKLAGFRSPHNSPNNIVHLVNVYPSLLEKYFSKLGDNVIVINGIHTDIQCRLNGQDLDSDAVYVTNQKEMAKLAEKAYKDYPTIVNLIGRVDSQYGKDFVSYARMDNNISSAQLAIGQATNIAQLALCYYYEQENKSRELEDVFIICSVLAQVAIDSAKREFAIDVGKEIYRLNHSNCMIPNDGKRYPNFYNEIQKKKPKYNIKPEQVRHFVCPMELLADIVEEKVLDIRKHKELQTETYALNEIFQYAKAKNRMENRKQQKKVIEIVEDYHKAVSNFDSSSEEYHKKVSNRFEECMKSLKNISINQATMSELIMYAFLPCNNMRDRLLTVLYSKNPNTFLNCFEKG